LVPGDASAMPFADNQFDLLVSNLGVNNFADPPAVLKECWRVARPAARLAITTNLQGHMQEFYGVYEDTLRELDRADRLPGLQTHVAHRATISGLEELFRQTGFRPVTIHQQEAVMRFMDGSVLLRHHFIKAGFLDAWKAILDPADREPVFARLEENLNHLAAGRGELALTIPMAYVEAEVEK
jgi:arsenite methyltransferase